MRSAQVVAVEVVLSAGGGQVLDQFKLVTLAHVHEPALDVGARKGQHLLDELALPLHAARDAHAQNFRVELHRFLNVLDYEPCGEKRLQHLLISC